MQQVSLTPRLKEYYNHVIVPQLKQDFGYTNTLAVPRLQKIVVNMGVGEVTSDSKNIQAALADLTSITGQKPLIRHARKSIAQFKLRKGMPIGCKVTLRRNMMYEFFDRLTSIVLVRIRDFRGLSSRSFDGRGNISLGLAEQIIFPEINYDKVDRIRGMDITIVTSARTDNEAKALLKGFNIPFKD